MNNFETNTLFNRRKEKTEGVDGLNKIFASLFLIIAMLSGCNFSSSSLSFSNIENVPDHVENIIDTNLKLQLINDGEKGSYIIFRSNGDINTNVEQQDDTVILINLNESDSTDGVEQQNIYYLTADPKPHKISVYVNGELTPFEMVTGL